MLFFSLRSRFVKICLDFFIAARNAFLFQSVLWVSQSPVPQIV